MENEITVKTEGAITTPQDEYNLLQSDLMKWIQLRQPQSIKDYNEGNTGDFYLGQEMKYMGNSFDCVLQGWRAKAVFFENGVPTKQSHDVNSDIFKDIMNRANNKEQGASYGIEYLVWLPEYGCFAILPFMKTARRNAPGSNVTGRACTIKSSKVKTPQYTWFVPQCIMKTETPDGVPEAPLDAFKNPSEETEEKPVL